MTNIKIDPEKIHIQSVRILNAHFSIKEDFDPDEFLSLAMGFKSETVFNLEKNLLNFKLFIKVEGLNKDEEFTGISVKYIIEYFYLIENLNDFADFEEDESYTISQQLGATIAGISYSTSRGIILDRTQTSEFNGILLPVVDPNKLLLEDTFEDTDLITEDG